MPTINERVALLRSQLAQHNLDAWIINGTDSHQSEYVAARWKSRAWISGFTGSAGSVLITATEALLWVDSRYFIQAEAQIAGTEFAMMKIDTPGSLDMNTYITQHLKAGQRVGIAAETLTISAKGTIETTLGNTIELVATDDLLDAIWSDRPAVPTSLAIQLSDDLAGFSPAQKLTMVRAALAQREADWTIISSLDDIAWLTNLRAGDVNYNPVFYSYALVGKERAWLFTDPARFSGEISTSLMTSFTLETYERITEVLKEVIKEGDRVYLNPERTSVMIADAIPSGHYVTGRDFTTDLKASKNETELEGMRRAHLLDGVALVNFLAKLDTKGGTYTEIEIAERLVSERERSAEYLGPSFAPISGWGEHGALPHYDATEASNATIEGDGLLVLDTGGHYRSGMTDVTRTILFGDATEEQRSDYTLVLKGNLALAGARFPEGTCGYQLDVLARQFLWQQGLAYHHGTGHGIGFRLNVHEGPHSISPKPIAVPLKKGMIISDEPGLYREGKHGIRIENIVAVQEDGTGEFGTFLSFEVLTICPFERTLIVKELLSETEVAMVDAYHRWVFEELKELVDESALAYLRQATSPL
ncbi:MAG: aminopeptidase P family protein [Sphaerochaeta sp.]|jgi:Xaa-Pro aminopeptidase|nr:aminopeptidase P family protein [Sphaerochaeta sp.]MDX9914819.1 aminopeptidase P family protein [Sphaerochaeta sp.]